MAIIKSNKGNGLNSVPFFRFWLPNNHCEQFGSNAGIARIFHESLKTPVFHRKMCVLFHHLIDTKKCTKKGDFIRYGDFHISTVYSPKSECDGDGDNCRYEIIHAYGARESDLDNNRMTPMEFSRKVTITPNMFRTTNETGWFPVPKGFGRVKLWD